MDICRGNLVYSLAGRDKGGLFLVVALENGYVYLADGKSRSISKPKKKKIMHVNRTNTIADINFDNLTDSEVRKTLSKYSD